MTEKTNIQEITRHLNRLLTLIDHVDEDDPLFVADMYRGISQAGEDLYRAIMRLDNDPLMNDNVPAGLDVNRLYAIAGLAILGGGIDWTKDKTAEHEGAVSSTIKSLIHETLPPEGREAA